MASGTIAVLLDVTPKAYFGTVPVGSNGQSLVFEIIISFLLMFVISGASTDSRAVNIYGLWIYIFNSNSSDINQKK